MFAQHKGVYFLGSESDGGASVTPPKENAIKRCIICDVSADTLTRPLT